MGMFSYISSLIYGNPEEHCCTCDDLNENTVTFKNQQIIDNVNQILSSPKLIDPTKRNGYFTETIVTKVNDSDNLIITDSVEIYAGEWYNGLKHGVGRLDTVTINENGMKKILYEGQFICNQKHGSGKLWIDDNKPIEGIWISNKLLECSS